ncbi:hypothetical protein [Sorangium sp. So ce1099]|uniref:hypothetical protein n=1 Tax=Sorangium sp. So ce1099 TaxID=3133331 RepID=UPI003F5DEDFE
MIAELFSLGERLAGRRDARLRRGLAFAFAEAVATAAPYALVLLFVRAALERRLSLEMTWWITGGTALAVILRSGRVAPGRHLPGAPTDPDVQISRIRLFETRLRYTIRTAVGFRSG